MIARLTAHCADPQPVDDLGRLRHLGARRERLIGDIVAEIKNPGPAGMCLAGRAGAAAQPRSDAWTAAMGVIMDRDGGDLARTSRLGWPRFAAQVRRESSRRGGQRLCLRIVANLFAALNDPAGVIEHRRGVFERLRFLLADWTEDQAKLADVEARMTGVLDDLELTELVTSITGISPVGAAAILAETGDPRRFTSARAMVKHAGLAPREKLSGTFTGRTKLTGQGRPGLRTAAWRAVWGAQRANPVYAERYRHLTARGQQAQAHPGPDRHRRRDLAPAPRRHHHRTKVGPSHRHPRDQGALRGQRRLTRTRTVEQTAGASPARH